MAALRYLRLPNWWVLADAAPADLREALLRAGPVRGVPPSPAEMENWVFAAQVQTLHEVMLAVLDWDGDRDALEALAGSTRSGMPADLAP